eukprot:4455465-Lingulodinium_polyedra.AAC.1
MGVDDLVRLIMDGGDERPNLHFLKGFSRLEARGRAFLVQAALVSKVPEGILSELMGDPRVAQTYPELWRCLARDMAWLVDQPSSLWE